MQPLSHIKVIELAGLAPVPFCGMFLADFGADVIVVNSAKNNMIKNNLCRGKRSVILNLKEEPQKKIFRHLLNKSDVLLDPYRPGVLEKLGFAPNELQKSNANLIITRLTGFGQPRDEDSSQVRQQRKMVGHDINYLAMSGILSTLGKDKETPSFPINLVADFAAGSLLCALGIIMALFNRNLTGKGEIIDCSMATGVSYISSFIRNSVANSPVMWPQPEKRGHNLLDGGAPFYQCYKTKDDKFVAVGALEPQFFHQLISYLGLESEGYNQFDIIQWSRMTNEFGKKFVEKTRDEWWNRVADFPNCCVSPVLSLEESGEFWSNDHYKQNDSAAFDVFRQPRLASSDNRVENQGFSRVGENTREVLAEFGVCQEEIDKMLITSRL